MDPRLLYTVDSAAWASVEGTRPVMIHLLEGYVDAGQIARQLSQHLLDTLEHELVVEFDHDQLHDYRSRRPQMVFATNQWVTDPEFQLALHKVTDASGRLFLLLTGPEPDTQWNRATRAVLGIADQLGVSELVSAQGVPMGVPHTRPVLVTAHATAPELVQDNPVWIARVQVPGSFAAMLELRAGQASLLGRGFVAHVPHYLAPGSWAPGALAVLDRIRDDTGLDLPPGELAAQALAMLAQLETEVANDGELGPMVLALEQQYDELAAAGRPSVPSAEEIGAAVEQFLAEQDPEDGDDAAH